MSLVSRLEPTCAYLVDGTKISIERDGMSAKLVHEQQAIVTVASDPEPPTLRPGAILRAKQDTKSINGLNIPKEQLLRVTKVEASMVTTRIGEHGDWMVATVKPGEFEVVG